MNILIHEGVGFFAGTIIACSALPRVIDIVRDSKAAKNESYARNAMMVLGNSIWVVYGISGELLATACMCTLSALLNGTILVAAVRANRHERR